MAAEYDDIPDAQSDMDKMMKVGLSCSATWVAFTDSAKKAAGDPGRSGIRVLSPRAMIRSVHRGYD
jgi:hypothetical protein